MWDCHRSETRHVHGEHGVADRGRSAGEEIARRGRVAHVEQQQVHGGDDVAVASPATEHECGCDEGGEIDDAHVDQGVAHLLPIRPGA